MTARPSLPLQERCKSWTAFPRHAKSWRQPERRHPLWKKLSSCAACENGLFITSIARKPRARRTLSGRVGLFQHQRTTQEGKFTPIRGRRGRTIRTSDKTFATAHTRAHTSAAACCSEEAAAARGCYSFGYSWTVSGQAGKFCSQRASAFPQSHGPEFRDVALSSLPPPNTPAILHPVASTLRVTASCKFETTEVDAAA